MKTRVFCAVLAICFAGAVCISPAVGERPEPRPEPGRVVMEQVRAVHEEPVTIPEPEWNVIESATVTAYCPCAKCCGKWADGVTATGVKPVAGRTVAVDPKVIPLGAEVLIDGAVYIAEDTGVRGEAADIFMDRHGDALQWGVQELTIYWRMT